MKLSGRLPDFPWDSLAGVTALARAHAEGIVDLSVGSPVDPTPQIARTALAGAADTPGYPAVWGTAGLRASIIDYLQRRWGAVGLVDAGVMPTIGSKELIGWLPTLLGLGTDDLVVIPELAYPTYEVGAAMVGARVQRCDDPTRVDGRPALIWLNSPANPHGAVMSADQLREWVAFARQTGAVLASDECYLEFGWTGPAPTSVLDAAVCGDTHARLLAVHSASKWANFAGYRAGFVAGDPDVVAELVAVRKNLGMMMSAPVQAAFGAVLAAAEDVVPAQRERYRARREVLAPALRQAGLRIDASDGGLYLWVTRDEDGRDSVAWLASLGILGAPGDFYGPAGADHVRLALTATDERIGKAAARLRAAA